MQTKLLHNMSYIEKCMKIFQNFKEEETGMTPLSK